MSDNTPKIGRCDRIFVYGTLKNLKAVKEFWDVEPTKVEKAMTSAIIYSAGEQPIMLEGEGTVHGLLLTIPEMADNPGIFDKYESCCNNSPVSFHFRKMIAVKTKTKPMTLAWAYVGNTQHKRVKKVCVKENHIKSGEWKPKHDRLHGPLE